MGKRYQVTEQISNINIVKWHSERTPHAITFKSQNEVAFACEENGKPKNIPQIPPQRSLPQLLKSAHCTPLEGLFPDLMHTQIDVQHSKGTRSTAQGIKA